MFQILDNFEIVEIEVFVDISRFNFRKLHTPRGLSGCDWQYKTTEISTMKAIDLAYEKSMYWCDYSLIG